MAPKAIFLSLSRQLLFLMPALLLLPHLFNWMGWEASWGVWCAMPFSDLLSMIVTTILLIRELRRFRTKTA